MNILTQLKAIALQRPAGRYWNHYESSSGLAGYHNTYYYVAAIDEKVEWMPGPNALGAPLGWLKIGNSHSGDRPTYAFAMSDDAGDWREALKQEMPSVERALAYAEAFGKPL